MPADFKSREGVFLIGPASYRHRAKGPAMAPRVAACMLLTAAFNHVAATPVKFITKDEQQAMMSVATEKDNEVTRLSSASERYAVHQSSASQPLVA
eukprot:2209862-Prymnesium_polylepis.1